MKCLKKARFLKVSRKSRSNFVKKQCSSSKIVISRVGGGRGNRQSDRQTDRRINGLGECGRRWLFWRVWERGEMEVWRGGGGGRVVGEGRTGGGGVKWRINHI